LLATLVNEVESRLSATGHSIQLELGGRTSIPVRIDRIRLSMVFANLIDNAQKYTSAGSTIWVGARPEPPAREVEVWVRDDGPGIPAVELTKMFARFYRVEKGRSRETGGTGLGLSIVKRIVQLHGGRIWAESEVGKGTRIIFRLPQEETRNGTVTPAAMPAVHNRADL
jgi:two-component system phosphate regulon sensor histidine kinase PhoR